jgi:site-specific recombinase
VIVLASLTLISTVAVAIISSRSRKSATQDDEGQATLTESGTAQDPSVMVLTAALDHLARVAEREAAESDEARRETATLRAQLEQMMGQLHEARRRAEQAESALAVCREHARLLSQQALQRGADD